MNRRRAFWFSFSIATFALMMGISAYVATPQAGPPINCRYVSCACPDCLENEHLEVPPGACCPVCVPN